MASDSNEYETVWVEIENLKDKNILICCAYRHPSFEIEHFNEYFQMTLSSPSVANKHVFILGDFNINLLDYDSYNPTCDFVSSLLSQHFLPYIIHPTRVSDYSSTIIDNIFSNICNLNTISGNILTQVADHFPQFLIVKKAGIASKTQSYYQHYYSNFDQVKFLSDFKNLNFEYLNDNQTNVCAKCNRFLVHVDEIVKKHAPWKMFAKKDIKLQAMPRISNRIQKMMRVRDKLLKRLWKRSDAGTKHLYKQFRNRVL